MKLRGTDVHIGLLCLFSFLMWAVLLPGVIQPKYPSHARPRNKKIDVCIGEDKPSLYGVYLHMVPFLPNQIHFASDESSISACIEKRYAVVLSTDDVRLSSYLVGKGYHEYSKWAQIKNGLAWKPYVKAITSGDSSSIMNHYATYLYKSNP